MLKKQSALGLLSGNETKIAALYTLYNNHFPDQEKLWKKLADEEKGHAAILARLDRLYGNKPESFSSSAYSETIIGYVSDFIDKSITEARAGHVSRTEALTTAIRLEHSMVEKKYFEVFTPKEAEIEMAFEKLNRETREHARRLEKTGLALGVILNPEPAI